MNTSAVAAALAADAPDDAVSEVDVVSVVPSDWACVLIASSGPIKYWICIVNDVQRGLSEDVTHGKFCGSRAPAL